MIDDAVAEAGLPPFSALRQVRLIRAVFIAAVLALAGVAVLAYYSTGQNAEDARWVDHTYEVIVDTGAVFSDLRGATASARGYAMTNDPSLLERYREYASAVPVKIEAVRGLIGDNPPQVARLERLSKLADQELHSLLQLVTSHQASATVVDESVVAPIMASHRQMDDVVTVTQQMVAEEDQLLAARRAEAARGRRVTLWVIVAGNLVSLLVLLVCLWLLLREIAYRRRTEDRVKALNVELASRNAMLHASNRELDGFSYSISHDLRSPLRAMDGYATLLEARFGSVLDAEAKRLLGVIHDNTRRMATLIDDLLAFSRLGRKGLEPEALDMTAMATQSVADILQVSTARPQVVVASLPACRGDRTLVRQVWMNLIGNAVKYSSQNPAARVEIHGQVKEGEYIYSVRDNGVGFDMQYYHKLFGVFQRLHGIEEFPGTGVGLAIVMRIVTKHGGRIWAEAILGQGAAFFFSIPRMEDA